MLTIRQTLATTRRVLSQLRHDPRTIALVLVVPCVLMTTLRFVYQHKLRAFDAVGAPLLSVFPLATMFVVSSVALLRERTTGTLERLLTTPLSRLALLGGYALAFALLATLQAVLVSALALAVLGLSVAGPTAMVVVVCVAVAILGMGLGLLASAFAQTEFQVVQFFPAAIYPQMLLAGLLVPRQRMVGVLARNLRRDASLLCGGRHAPPRSPDRGGGGTVGGSGRGRGLRRRLGGPQRGDSAPPYRLIPPPHRLIPHQRERFAEIRSSGRGR
jgi:ABC-2 type transport system permease protein